MVDFRYRRPDARLAPFVKMYFWGRDTDPPPTQRTIPNGEMGVCFYRHGTVIYDGVGEIRSCIAGQDIKYQDIISQGAIEIVGTHFTTIGAHLFFNMPLNIFFRHSTRLEDIDDEGFARLEEEVMLAPNHRVCWDIFDTFFLERLSRSNDDALNLRRLQRALAYGHGDPTRTNVADAASEACLSTRHFNRLFSQMIGLPPKEFLRLLRFHNALRNLKNQHFNTQHSLTEIACDSGYYDLSHMSSEFREISGLSPKELLSASENDNDPVGWRM